MQLKNSCAFIKSIYNQWIIHSLNATFKSTLKFTYWISQQVYKKFYIIINWKNQLWIECVLCIFYENIWERSDTEFALFWNWFLFCTKNWNTLAFMIVLIWAHRHQLVLTDLQVHPLVCIEPLAYVTIYEITRDQSAVS